jgi:hypothetical protein
MQPGNLISRRLFFGLLCTLFLQGCGGDEISQPLFLSSGATIDVTGKYDVSMNPLASSCYELYPTASFDRFYVVQYGNQIFIDIDQQSGYFDPYSAIYVSSTTFEGDLDYYGGFYAVAPGSYTDGYGYQGPSEWYISGSFDYAYGTIEGVSDISLIDPYSSCVVSHTFVGYR